MLLIKIFMLFAIGFSFSASFAEEVAVYDPTYFEYPEFSMALSDTACSIYKGGTKLQVPMSYSGDNKSKQSLFYFFLNNFDKNKKTILVNNGGPGAVLAPNSDSYSYLSTIYNIVSYHSRGSGCSAEPMSLEANQYINLESEISDIDEIRKSIGLEKWSFIYGVSAGTNVARMYANRLPDRVEKIVLVGVDGEEESESDLQRIYKNIWKRFVDNQRINILNRYSDKEILVLGEKFSEFMNSKHEVLEALVLQQILKPEFRKNYSPPTENRALNLLPLVLSYTGSDEDTVTAFLLEFVKHFQYSGLDLSGTNYYADAYSDFFYRTFFNENLERDDFGELPFKLSWRANFLLNTNVPPLTSTCHKVPQLIIQGGEDQATPEKNAENIFNNSSCYPSTAVFIKNEVGGHFNAVSENCEMALIYEFSSAPQEFKLPKFCSKDLVVKQR